MALPAIHVDECVDHRIAARLRASSVGADSLPYERRLLPCTRR
jgi:hypothetical protein